MQIKLWANFSKRYNSTKLPSEDDATSKNVSLKQPTDTEAPTFILEDTIASDWNYCQFLNNFYFINKIVIVNNNIIELQCVKDYLGTWKGYIALSNAFIERAESAYDPLIDDGAISQNHTSVVSFSDETLDFYDNGGCYLLQTASYKGINTYALVESSTVPMVSTLMRHLLGNGQDSAVRRLVDSFPDIINNAVFNPMEHIISFNWIPVSYSTIIGYGVQDAVAVGWTAFEDIGAYRLTRTNITSGVVNELVTPFCDYTDWRKYNNNWAQYSIYLPAVGNIPIDSNIVKNTVGYSYYIDLINCTITYYLYELAGQSNRLLGIYDAPFGYSIPLTQSNYGNLLHTVGNTALSALTGGLSSGASAIATIGGGTIGVLNSFSEPPSIIANYSSRAPWLLNTTIRFNCRYFGTKQEPIFTEGRPLMEYRQLNTLTGFVKCSNASIDIPSHGDDKQVVNNFLNTGFYLE